MNANLTGTAFLPHPAQKRRILVLWLAGALALFFSTSLAMAQNQLLRLIPPGAPVIAGLHRMTPDQSSAVVWLATRKNFEDLASLENLTESDLDGRFEQVVVADWASDTDPLGSHLLIAEGRFSLAAISSTMAHPVMLSYQGIRVLVLQAKEGSRIGARWLAVPDKHTALFGTPSAVQVALDRFRGGAVADADLVARLNKVRDAAWSSVVLQARPEQTPITQQAEAGALTPCLNQLREVELGIQVGTKVSIHLQAESRDGSKSAACIGTALFSEPSPQLHIVFGGEKDPAFHVTMARAEYEAWLDSFQRSRLPQTLEAMLSEGGSEAASGADNQNTLR